MRVRVRMQRAESCKLCRPGPSVLDIVQAYRLMNCITKISPIPTHTLIMLLRQTGALLIAASAANALRNASPFFLLSTEA